LLYYGDPWAGAPRVDPPPIDWVERGTKKLEVVTFIEAGGRLEKKGLLFGSLSAPVVARVRRF
jgi:hypothetical protein